jgi:uncharacterized membrane protein YheB (UPF0754 family)
MANELVSLQEAIKNEVREVVLKYVPQETVNNIIKSYLETEFKDLVKNELTMALKDKFKKDIEYQATIQYDRNGQETLNKVSSETAKYILEGFGQSLVQTVMNSLRNNIRY